MHESSIAMPNASPSFEPSAWSIEQSAEPLLSPARAQGSTLAAHSSELGLAVNIAMPGSRYDSANRPTIATAQT